NVAGIKLKSKDGWKRNPVDDKDGNGTDDYGFTALQGGFGIGGLFNDDDMGEWWSTTQFVADVAHSRAMSIYSENVRKFDSKKFFFYSVRCLKD
ncbi:MAG: fibrobacter succinogenes major paralogous domain-containing protein, partial [Fibromonadaceae bacterium]|nr:fibrobacter succinogenes major paralogous domain-containing protein [Fibromonadaceae bacterium]